MENCAINSLCSVLVSSCDKYEDAWRPFFKLVEKFWGDSPFTFYLNTETKGNDSIEYKNGVAVLNTPASVSWGARLRGCLERIDSDYVILLLEDFFLQDYVDQDEIDRFICHMQEDSNLVCVYFRHIRGFNTPSPKLDRYCEMTDDKIYKTNSKPDYGEENR